VSEAGLSTDNYQFAPANTTANNAATNEGLTERLSYINLNFTGLSLNTVANSAVSNLIPETQIRPSFCRIAIFPKKKNRPTLEFLPQRRPQKSTRGCSG
jgi:hypothetical protein